MTETILDVAHAAMNAEPDDDAARLKFYERLADGELFLLLEKDAMGDDIVPQTFPTEGGTFVLIFDREERLAEFAGKSAPYAAISGRSLAAQLAGQDIGMGLNVEVAPSSILIPADAVTWLNDTLGTRPSEVEDHPEDLRPPAGLPENLVASLDQKLAATGGMAKIAYLAAVTYRGGRNGHVLALIDAAPGSETALSRAVGEALIFSGLEAGEIDVTFFDASDPMAAKLAKVGLRFDLPQPELASGHMSSPGMDPDRPPRLH